jgi:hypothetical protein
VRSRCSGGVITRNGCRCVFIQNFKTTGDDVASFAQHPETLHDHGRGEEIPVDEPCSTNDLVEVRQGAFEGDFSVEQTLAVDIDSSQVPSNNESIGAEAETLLVRGEVGNTENALPIGDVEQEKVESPSTSLASLIIVTLMSWSKI